MSSSAEQVRADVELVEQTNRHLEHEADKRAIRDRLLQVPTGSAEEKSLHAQLRVIAAAEGNSLTKVRGAGGVWGQQQREFTAAERAQVAAIDKRLAGEHLKSAERLALYDEKTKIYSGRR